MTNGKIPTPAAYRNVPTARGWQNSLHHGLPEELKWEVWHTIQSVVNKSKCFAKTYLVIYDRAFQEITCIRCLYCIQISTNDLAASERPGMGARSRKYDPRASSSWTTSKETLRIKTDPDRVLWGQAHWWIGQWPYMLGLMRYSLLVGTEQRRRERLFLFGGRYYCGVRLSWTRLWDIIQVVYTR